MELSDETIWAILPFEYKKKGRVADGLKWDLSPMMLEKYRQKAQSNPSFYRVFDSAYNLTNKFKAEIKYRTTGERNIIIEVTGQTGCLSDDTLILNHFNRGVKYSVEKKVISTKSFDFDNWKVVDSLSFMIPSGFKEVFDLRVGDKFLSIKASADHKFFVFRDDKVVEVMVKDLKLGDKIIRYKRSKK